jgi:transcriptional regulator with XRE-family HTH domain
VPKVLPDEREERGRASWAAQLNERLRVQGITRQRLAAEVGIGRAQLDKYADGTVTPPGKHLGRIATILDYDIFEQLERLGWLDQNDVRVARERRFARRRLRIHDELQRLVRLDSEINGVSPATHVLQPLMQDGWTVRHWRDWRGSRRRVSYLDIFELSPPSRLRPLLADTTVAAPDRPLPVVDRIATRDLTRAEQRLREIAVEAIGQDRFHAHECYWSERERHRVTYRDRSPAEIPGLVLAVPWLLRRRYPSDEAALLTHRGERMGSGLSSLAIIGLPYSGGPDVAALVADEVLGWGYAGVAMLTRERWHATGGELGEQREQQTARLLARGDDPRMETTVWFYNHPAALIGSVDQLASSIRRSAVVHLRFSDAAIDEFLLPQWGGTPGRERQDLMAWREVCDAAQRSYTRSYPEDWLTIDVELSRDHVGFDGEDAREDLYLADIAGQVEAWLSARFDVRRPDVLAEEQPLLALLAAPESGTYSEAEMARALGITRPAAKLMLANVMIRHGLTTREDLYSFARWRITE